MKNRGRCPNCRKRFSLLKSGMLAQHKIYTYGIGRYVCAGSGKTPEKFED